MISPQAAMSHACQGSRVLSVCRPSDTTFLRLSEPDLAEQDVHLRDSVDRDFQMVREDCNVVEELVNEHSAFLIGRDFPDRVEIEITEYFDDRLESFEELVAFDRFAFFGRLLSPGVSRFAA